MLLLHGTGGTGKSFLAPTLADNLFGPDQPLDLSRFYVVLPDGIGAGGSTSPSDGLHARFPHYGYNDQVVAQHALLDALKVDHLRLVSGISQGGMQSWLWAERYPEAADAYVPIASMPMQISGRNLMWRQIIIHAIEEDPDYHGGEYSDGNKPKVWGDIAGPLFVMMVGTPQRLQESAPDRAKTLAFDAALAAHEDGLDPNDALYDLKSSADYDPAPAIGRIYAPLTAINFADDEVNPASLPVTAETVARIPSGRFVLLPGGYGHSTIFHAEAWGSALAAAMKR